MPNKEFVKNFTHSHHSGAKHHHHEEVVAGGNLAAPASHCEVNLIKYFW